MTTPIKPVSPVLKVPARAKRPIGRTCMPCAGRGWVRLDDPTHGRKVPCQVCKGKGRIVT